MLDSTVELISLAASNSLFVFCFCNLIIAIILMGSKSGSAFGDGNWVPIPMPTCTSNNNETRLKEEAPSDRRGEGPVEETEEARTQCNIQIKSVEGEGDDDKEDEHHEDGGGGGGDDDELRTRIEDFIAKVNRERQAEKLRENQQFGRIQMEETEKWSSFIGEEDAVQSDYVLR